MLYALVAFIGSWSEAYEHERLCKYIYIYIYISGVSWQSISSAPITIKQPDQHSNLSLCSKTLLAQCRPYLAKSLNSSRCCCPCPSSFSNSWNGGIPLSSLEEETHTTKTARMQCHHPRRSSLIPAARHYPAQPTHVHCVSPAPSTTLQRSLQAMYSAIRAPIIMWKSMVDAQWPGSKSIMELKTWQSSTPMSCRNQKCNE